MAKKKINRSIQVGIKDFMEKVFVFQQKDLIYFSNDVNKFVDDFGDTENDVWIVYGRDIYHGAHGPPGLGGEDYWRFIKEFKCTFCGKEMPVLVKMTFLLQKLK